MSAPQRGDVAAEVFGIATMYGSLEERAQALLEPLSRLVHYDAAWISLLDPERRLQQTIACHGYPQRVRRFLNSAAFMAEVELTSLHRRRPPIRVSDCPVPVDELEAWTDYIEPAGFNEGVSIPLSTIDGRYLGIFGTHTESRVPVSDDVCDELARLGPLIAHALDPMRSISALAALVGDAAAGIVLTRSGRLEPLPGLPGDALLEPASPLLPVVDAVLTARAHAAFLMPRPEATGGLSRVTVLSCPPQPPGHHRAVVLLSPPPDLHGLTTRELQVLGMLVDGYTNAAMAAALHITQRTTVGHVEHVMSKLGAASRTIAALRAEREGLYIPAGSTERLRRPRAARSRRSTGET